MVIKNLILIGLLFSLSSCVSISRYNKDIKSLNESIEIQNKINKSIYDFEKKTSTILETNLEIINTMRESIDLLKIYNTSNENRIINLEKKQSRLKEAIPPIPPIPPTRNDRAPQLRR